MIRLLASWSNLGLPWFEYGSSASSSMGPYYLPHLSILSSRTASTFPSHFYCCYSLLLSP